MLCGELGPALGDTGSFSGELKELLHLLGVDPLAAHTYFEVRVVELAAADLAEIAQIEFAPGNAR